MKRPILSSLLIFSILLSPSLKADTPVGQEEVSIEQTGEVSPSEKPPAPSDTLVTEETSEEQGTPVGQASHEGRNAAKRKQWQNIAIAACAVAVAVTALILVSSNNGHKH